MRRTKRVNIYDSCCRFTLNHKNKLSGVLGVFWGFFLTVYSVHRSNWGQRSIGTKLTSDLNDLQWGPLPFNIFQQGDFVISLTATISAFTAFWVTAITHCLSVFQAFNTKTHISAMTHPTLPSTKPTSVWIIRRRKCCHMPKFIFTARPNGHSFITTFF